MPASRRLSLFERNAELFAVHKSKFVHYFENDVGTDATESAWEAAKSLSVHSSIRALDFERDVDAAEPPLLDLKVEPSASELLAVDPEEWLRIHVPRAGARKPQAAPSLSKLKGLMDLARSQTTRPVTELSAAEKIDRVLGRARQPTEPQRGEHVGEGAWQQTTAVHLLTATKPPPQPTSVSQPSLVRSSSAAYPLAKSPSAKGLLTRGSTRALLLASAPARATSQITRSVNEQRAGRKRASPSRTRRVRKSRAAVSKAVAGGQKKALGSRGAAAIGINEMLSLDGISGPRSEEMLEAGQKFNDRHATHSLRARQVLSVMGHPPRLVDVPLESEHVFSRAAAEVFRNRLFVSEAYDPFIVPQKAKAKGRQRQRWHIDNSIWAPRKKYGNSKDYYETERVLRNMFETDWEFARQAHGLDKAVQLIDSKGEEGGQRWVDADGNGVHDSIDATKETLWRHSSLLYGVFDYYCTIFGAKTRTKQGEYDIFNMQQNAYTEFCRDCSLDARISMSLLTIIFVSVNAKEEKTAHLDEYNHKHQLNRHEFLQCIVKIAIETYVLGKASTDDEVADEEDGSPARGRALTVSAAVERTCQDILREAPPECHQNSNAFRRHRCYNEHTDAALRKHEGSLRRIFEGYAAGNRNATDNLQKKCQMSVGEWCSFVQHLGLLESGQMSIFGAHMTFKWSIIRTASDYSAASISKVRNMMFEDFLEALVRVASVIALPTDVEVKQAGAEDAGEFLIELINGVLPHHLKAFVDARRVAWLHEPRQAVHRCVAHLLSLIMRTVERNTSRVSHGKANMIVDSGEIFDFARFRSEGFELNRVAGRAGLLDSIRAAASVVRTRLVEALREVEILAGLDEERLATLADAMADSQYSYDDYIFEQDDDGDSFYVIIEGKASVVRQETTDAFGKEEVFELAELSRGMVFGERALLKRQTRYAGVRVDSQELHCVSITRARFEEAMGCKLEELVPDKYKLDKGELERKLRTVRLFGWLSAEQLSAMVDAMTEMHYPQGDYIFREADPGDACYVILSGTASVRKFDNDGVEVEIAVLGQWACFGERAMLKNEVRYASICATSLELSCLRISREGLEEVLGVPPKDVLREEEYKDPNARRRSPPKRMPSGRTLPRRF